MVDYSDSDETGSSSPIELLNIEILDSEDDGIGDPVASALESTILERKSQELDQEVEEMPKEESISNISSSAVNILEGPRTDVLSEPNINRDIPESIESAKERSHEVKRQTSHEINRQSHPSIEPKQQSTKRTSSLAQLCSKTTNIRSRTGLSKRVRIASLHPNLNKKAI